jgi:hypothetical protein
MAQKKPLDLLLGRLVEAVNEQWKEGRTAAHPARGEPSANSHAGSGQQGRLRPG